MKAYKSQLAERCTKEQLHEAVHGKKPQTKPLSDEELREIFRKYFPRTIFSNGFKQFARDAIEKAHEIK